MIHTGGGGGEGTALVSRACSEGLSKARLPTIQVELESDDDSIITLLRGSAYCSAQIL